MENVDRLCVGQIRDSDGLFLTRKCTLDLWEFIDQSIEHWFFEKDSPVWVKIWKVMRIVKLIATIE